MNQILSDTERFLDTEDCLDFKIRPFDPREHANFCKDTEKLLDFRESIVWLLARMQHFYMKFETFRVEFENH